MSNGEVRKVLVQDIQFVQDLIERCLQLYMSETEVVSTLLHQAKIEPEFTELVWQKLEAQNQEFFRAYHLRLIVKDQIVRFNQLLERQLELMRQVYQTGVSNGSQVHSIDNNPAYHVPQPIIKPENMHQPLNTLPNGYNTNGTSSVQPSMQVSVNMAAENMLLSHNNNSNTGMVQGMNGLMIKTERGYDQGDSSSPFMFGGGDSSILEPRSAIGEAAVSSPFNGGETNSQALSETLLDQEMNAFGFLGQIPRNFSLSDLTADFSNSSDILESYSRSPFMGADTNFVDPQIRGEQQDIRRLDTISEGLSYEDFGSD